MLILHNTDEEPSDAEQSHGLPVRDNPGSRTLYGGERFPLDIED